MLFLIILIVSLIAQFFLPWWIIAPVAFLAAFWKGNSGTSAFGAGLLALFVCWLGMALVTHFSGGDVLSNRVAQIFKLPNGLLLAIVSALVGGLVGGFAALSGYLVKDLMKPKASHR